MADINPSAEEDLSTTDLRVDDSSDNSSHGSADLPLSFLSCSSAGATNGSSLGHKDAQIYYSYAMQEWQSIYKKNVRVFRCDVCGLCYRHVFSLKRHFFRNHVSLKYISPADMNNCKINAKSPEADEEDLETSPDSPVISTDKGAHIINDKNLKDRNGELVRGVYRCHMCTDVSFDTTEEVKQHYQQHPSKTSFPCPTCNVLFPNKQALYRHATTHTGTDSFPCTICNEIFTSRLDYIAHSATHTDNRTCKYCQKVLSTKANKSRHERIHEGLKPYTCKHCDFETDRNPELRDHTRQLHSEFYLSCAFCTSLLSSKTALRKHMTDHHPEESLKSVDKLATPAKPLSKDSSHNSKENSTVKKKPVASKTEVKSSTEQKVHHCTVCRKAYQTYIGMLHHRRRLHPFAIPARKVHRKTKYFTRGARRLFGPQKSSDMPEEEFYKTISMSIAENLLNYVDGKTSQLSLRQYNFNDQAEQGSDVPLHESPFWSHYNFPKGFDVDQALYVRGQEIKGRSFDNNPMPNEMALYNEFSLMNNHDMQYTCDDSEDSDCDLLFCNGGMYIDYKNINVEERKKLIGRQVSSIIICCVCKEKLLSHKAFEDHSANNHPNVQCTFLEIEGEKDSPPVVPEDLRWQFLSPVGAIFSCFVPPPTSDKPVISCTKCKFTFPNVSELHQHIISCGGSETTSFHIRKTIIQRKIKRTMKTRIDTAFIKSYRRKMLLNNASAAATANSYVKAKKEEPATLPTVKPLVGRPKSVFKSSCPHCKQTFRTKTLLSSHINRCYKRVVMRDRCLKMTLKKAEAMRQKPQNVKNQSSSSKASLTGKEKNSDLVKTDQVPTPPQIESPIERLSPSFEVLLNSINEKLTSEELSPSHPTFSWMEDEHFIVPSQSSQTSTASENPEGSGDHEKMEVQDSPSVDSSATKLLVDESEGAVTTGKVAPEQALESELSSDKNISSAKFCKKIQKEAMPKKRSKGKIASKSCLFEEEECVDSPEPEILDVQSEDVSPVCSPPINDTATCISINSAVKNVVNDAMANAPKATDSTAPVSTQLPSINKMSAVPAPKPTNDSSIPPPTDSSVASKVLATTKTSANKGRNILSRGNMKCPHCLMTFLSPLTLHRHVGLCLAKQNKREEESQQRNSHCLMMLPKKDEVEDSMITLLRHQSRQSKMMKEAKMDDSGNVKKFQTYTCESCHKIFLSLFKLLQHRVVHKLQNTDDKSALSNVTTDIPSASGSPNSSDTSAQIKISDDLKNVSVGTPKSSEEASVSSKPSEGSLENIKTLSEVSEASLEIAKAKEQLLELASTTLAGSSPASGKKRSFQAAFSPEALHVEIPKRAPNLSDAGPSSAPVLLESANSDSLSPAELPRSSSTEPHAETNSLGENQAFLVKPGKFKLHDSNLMQNLGPNSPASPAVVEEANQLTTPKKRRKKIKTIVVRKRPQLFKKNLKERAQQQKEKKSSLLIKTENQNSEQKIIPATKEETKEPSAEIPATKEETKEPSAEIPAVDSDVDIEVSDGVDNHAAPEVFHMVDSPVKKSKKTTSENSAASRTCPICGKTFTSVNYRKKHMLSQHPEQITKSTTAKPLDNKPKKILAKNNLLKKKKKKQKRNVLKRECKKQEVPSKKIVTKKSPLRFGKSKR